MAPSIDREKVIEELEHCRQLDFEMKKPTQVAIDNALAMLKKQEAIPVDTKVIGTSNGDVKVYCCRNCRMVLDPWFHYCPNCGRQIKWNA